MSARFSQIGSAPSAPTQLVGRETDLAKLKALITKTGEKQTPTVVRLQGRLLDEARSQIMTAGGSPLTIEQLAERAHLSKSVIINAKNGKPVKRNTAASIANVLRKPVEELTAPSGEEIALQALVVVRGLPGVGKTTLASALAHDAELHREFESCLWASLGQSSDSLSELKAWGRALGVDIDQEKDKKYARARLTAFLKEKRLLIIIDDAWTSEPAFDLMVGGPRCATVVTTRVTDVADAIAPTEEDIYLLNVLTVDNAVKLLEELAESVVAEHPADVRKLVEELECLPLALQVAGRLLRAEQRKGLGVSKLLEYLGDPANILPHPTPSGPKIAALLNKSTDVLDYEAQKCFAYLAPFPDKPATFDQPALKKLWQGITEDPEQMRDLLISRGLLEPAKGGRFWLHALLVAHARSLLAARSSRIAKPELGSH